MQAPPTPTPTHPHSARDRDLIVVPEAGRTLPRWILFTAAGLAAGLILGAALAWTVQRSDLRARDDALAAAVGRARTTEGRVSAGAAQIQVLETRVADLQVVLDLSRARIGVVGASRAELRRELAAARAELDRAREQLATLAGVPLAAGPHTVLLVAVGPTQEPPLVIVDPGRWFRGERARQAAIADGAIMPGEVLPHGHYLRNTTQGWRTIPLDPAASVSVRGWHRHAGATVISVEDLQQALRSTRAWAERIRHDPFRIVVDGGRVTVLAQLRYP